MSEVSKSTVCKSENNRIPYIWCIVFGLIWIVVGCVPLILALIGDKCFSLANSEHAEIAGTIGDAFGLVNSFFSGAALLLVVWSIRLQKEEIRFAREEWRANTKSQDDQARFMERTVRLAAVNNIYNHYSAEMQPNSHFNVKKHLSAGHREWAIREMFDSIDPNLSSERQRQVHDHAKRLVGELSKIIEDENHRIDMDDLYAVSRWTASLLIDTRVDVGFRKSLWGWYELLRTNAGDATFNKVKFRDPVFMAEASKIVTQWNQCECSHGKS